MKNGFSQQFGFVIFSEIIPAADKILVKLTTDVNIINILQANFSHMKV
jgi:hypothetical protein